MARTLVTGTILRSGSIPPSALPAGTITSSVQLVNTLPIGVVSSSTQVNYTQLQNIPTDIVSSSTQVTTFLPTGTVSSSTQLPSGIASSSAQVKVYLPPDTVSSSAQITIFLPTGTVSSSGQINVFNTVGGDSLATTGSNTFTGVTAISDTTNSTSYLDGSLTVAGGMSVRKDVRISGSMTINGLLTVVSMSSQYVTSSQYNLGVSKVTVNDDDNVRFAGLSVYDSGSSSPATASIYWDSLKHKFIYENLSGSSYNSALFIAGPKNTGSLGDEVGLTSGYIPYATGDDHIDNSVIYQSGNTIGIGTTTPTSKLTIDTSTLAGIDIFRSDTNANFSAIRFRDTTNANNNAIIGWNVNELRLEATNAFRLVTNGLDRVYVDSSGNVLVGKTSNYGVAETNTLQVKSAIVLAADNTGSVDNRNWILHTNVSGPGNLDIVDSPSNNSWPNNAYRVTITKDGNVGIGVTNPGGKLVIQDGVTHASGAPTYRGSVIISSNGGNTTTAGGLEFHGSSFNNGFGWRISAPDLGEGAVPFVIQRRTDSVSWTETLRINNSGNIGIGTANPSNILEIYTNQVNGLNGIKINSTGSAANQAGLTLAAGNGPSTNRASRIDFINNVSSATVPRWTLINDYNQEGINDFRLVTSNPALSAITVLQSGNVGIGITNPTEKLHVTNGNILIPGGNVSGSGALVGTNSNDSFTTFGVQMPHYGLKWGAPTDAYDLGGLVGFWSSYYGLRMFTGGVEILRTTINNTVGIGTTNPTTKTEIYSTAADIPIARYTPHNVLTITGDGSAPYEGFGGGILFKNRRYNLGIQEGARIRSVLRFSGNPGEFQGDSIAFDTTPTTGSALTEAMRIRYDGNIGIGLSNPNYKLSVYGAAKRIGIENPSAAEDWSNADIGGYVFRTHYALYEETGMYAVGNFATYGYQPALTFKTAATERLRITPDGNVGINTTNPQSKFHLNTGDLLRTNSDYVNGSAGSGFVISAVASSGATDALLYAFRSGNTAYGNIVIPGGSVGIGTTNIKSQLHVGGATTSTVSLGTVTYGGNVGQALAAISVEQQSDSVPGGALILQTNGWDTTAYLPTERVRITGRGTVSINNGSPPTLSGVNGIVMGNALILSGEYIIASPYTGNLQIDIVYGNWSSNNVIGIADIMVALREYANTSGLAFGKIFATNTSSGAAFTTFNTTDVTTSQCTVSATAPSNYTLRITIDPTNVTDRMSLYMVIPGNGGTGTGISSVTVSIV